MKSVLAFSILAIASQAALAVGTPETPVPTPSIPNILTQNQNLYVKPVLNTNISSDSSSSSTSSSTSSASSGDASSGVNFSNQGARTYVFPAPVSAAPLPGNLCPQGDSLSWSFG